MSNISIRGLDETALAQLKAQAARDGSSVNTLVLRLLDQALGRSRAGERRIRYTDLDALAGSWGAEEAAQFARATAPFGEVDADLWK